MPRAAPAPPLLAEVLCEGGRKAEVLAEVLAKVPAEALASWFSSTSTILVSMCTKF